MGPHTPKKNASPSPGTPMILLVEDQVHIILLLGEQFSFFFLMECFGLGPQPVVPRDYSLQGAWKVTVEEQWNGVEQWMHLAYSVWGSN